MKNDSSGKPNPEEFLWAQALHELEDGGDKVDGLWARCFAESLGDERLAKAKYLRERVGQLRSQVGPASDPGSPDTEQGLNSQTTDGLAPITGGSTKVEGGRVLVVMGVLVAGFAIAAVTGVFNSIKHPDSQAEVLPSAAPAPAPAPALALAPTSRPAELASAPDSSASAIGASATLGRDHVLEWLMGSPIERSTAKLQSEMIASVRGKAWAACAAEIRPSMQTPFGQSCGSIVGPLRLTLIEKEATRASTVYRLLFVSETEACRVSRRQYLCEISKDGDLMSISELR
jgi:hypothetical protein